jgi:hypothetical protein
METPGWLSTSVTFQPIVCLVSEQATGHFFPITNLFHVNVLLFYNTVSKFMAFLLEPLVPIASNISSNMAKKPREGIDALFESS